MSQSHHPLPVAPGQQERPGTRPRAKSTFSFHSRKSSGSGQQDLHETHEEKEKLRLKTKADPSVAMQEAEPSAVARSEKASLASIRAIQHRDAQGNPITDPDRSNPTRSRWERPLDTIRAFEAAIDGNYNRKSIYRADTSDVASTYNRRSSYYGGTQVTTDGQGQGPRYPQNGHPGYNGRTQSSYHRPDSTYADGRPNGMSRPDGYFNGMENGANNNGYLPNRARYPRTASEPQFNGGGGGGVYPSPGGQQSYETVTTASGSGSSADPAGYSTDPSSENSSVDRIHPLPKEPVDNYGFNGFGNNPQYAPPGSGLNENSYNGAQKPGNSYQSQAPPPVPQKQDTGPRAPIKLGASTGNAGADTSIPTRPTAEKRKSWFGRRFSKSDR